MVASSASFALVSFVLPSRASAQPVPAGSPFMVNTYTTSSQDGPAVASAGQEGFVVVWSSDGQDGDRSGVFGRRFDSDGNPLGGEFQVNTYTTDDQLAGAITSGAAGQFVVVWSSDGQDGDQWGVFGRRFDSGGNPLGDEFQVNTYTTGRQATPKVAADAAGQFVVTWNSEDQDGDKWGIFGQRFDSGGNPLGDEFQVNTYTNWDQLDSDIALAQNGDFVVVWGDGLYLYPSVLVWEVRGQRFGASGESLGSEFAVNTYTRFNQFMPAVTADVGGGFTVAWSSGAPCQTEAGRGPSSECYTVFGRRFDAEGTPITGELLASPSGYYSMSPAVASLEDNFIVVWNTESDVRGRQFAAAGNAIGGEFDVGSSYPVRERNSAVASIGERDFVVVWEHRPGSSRNIYGQLFSIPAPSLTVDGSCPGPVSVEISNAPPNSEVAVVAAANTNGFVKGGTLCPGVEFEIGEPLQLPPSFVIVDSGGRGSTELVLQPNRCNVQALALENCETSSFVLVPTQ